MLTDSVLTVQLIMLHTFARRYYLVLNKAMSDAFISYNLNFMSALYNNNNNKNLSNQWFICENSLVKPLEFKEAYNYIKYQK